MTNVRHLPGVHAKVVSTNQAALLGSANLTQSGFGARDEMGCLIYSAALVRTLCDWFDDLWSASLPIRDDDLLSCRHRPPRPRGTPGESMIGRGKIVHQPARSMGWLASRESFPPGAQCEANDSTAALGHARMREERNALVAQLKTIARSRSEVDTVLGLLAKALDISGLPLDDGRLHVNFGNTPVCVNINQRYVAWCSVERGVPQFGFILDSLDVATDAVRLLQGSWSGRFRKGGGDDLPTLHVPLPQLPRLPLAVVDSWQRAIRIEVERRRRDGKPWTSSYRKHIRPYLFYVLHDADIRAEIVRHSFPECWWFGVNNGPHGHVHLDGIRPFLSGERPTFSWPVGKSKPKRLYREMKPGDRVLIWTGHGRDADWGIIGYAEIAHVADEELVLQECVRFSSPITPYPSGHPQETEEVTFLRETFGADFVPLGDVMRAVYGTKRTPPITVSHVSGVVFQGVLEFANAHNGEMPER